MSDQVACLWADHDRTLAAAEGTFDHRYAIADGIRWAMLTLGITDRMSPGPTLREVES